MTIYYSAGTGGFYDPMIHDALFLCEEHVNTDQETGETIDRWCEYTPDPSGPIADAVEITSEEQAALLAGQSAGQRIVADENGRPVLADPPPIDNRHARIAELKALLAASDYKVLPDYDRATDQDLEQRSDWRSEIRMLIAEVGE